ncbi:MAG: serine/threonine-protein phosphatase [bacterium]|nr:serine/threonine-protein phosphatase [bacterium]
MVNSSEEQINQLLHRTRLRFPPDLEVLFYGDHYQKSIKTVRFALLLALSLYLLFGLRDYFIAPEVRFQLLLTRYAFICPLMLAAVLFSYMRFFKKNMQLVISIIAVLVGVGTTAMGMFDDIYYYGVLMVIMVCYTFFRLRFFYASVVCMIIIIGYNLAVVFYYGILDIPGGISLFVDKNCYLFTSYAIGMFLCYSIEIFSRKDFLRRILISDKQVELQFERKVLQKRNETVENDMLTARIIQQQLIPSKNPNKNIASFFQSMEPIGGDFFDFMNFREPELLGIFISDVSGHGVSAALITSMVKSIILGARRFKNDPASLLTYLNDMLMDETGGNFITAFYGIYNHNTRVLTYSNAGHNPPYLIQNGKVEKLPLNNGLPLAILDNHEVTEDKKYKNKDIELPVDSKLLLYTDGLVEAAINNDPKFQFDNVIEEKLLQHKSLAPKEFIESLYEDLVDYTGKTSFEDDICVICMDVI